MKSIFQFIKQYRLYVIVIIPIVIATVIAVIIVASENQSPPKQTGSETSLTELSASDTASQTFTVSDTSSGTDTGISSDTDTTPPQTEVATFPMTEDASEIIPISESENNTLILSGSINVPVFQNPNGSSVIASVNSSLHSVGELFTEYALGIPLSAAKDALNAGGIGLPYYFTADYTVTNNSSTVLSVVFVKNEATGGSHEYMSNYCVNYDLATGAELKLSEVFSCSYETCLDRLITYAEALISQNPELYFDDYSGLIRRASLSNKWYFNSEGLVLVYNPFEIAPYTTGIVTFTVPYSEISDILTINPLDVE